VEWAVSLVLPVRSAEEVWGSTLVESIKFYTTRKPTTRCHMAAHDWATWHLSNQSNTATCRALDGPCICHVPCHLSPYLPSQPTDIIHATLACAMCHPYSGDTCHPLTGPTVPILCSITYHMSSPEATMSAIWSYGLYSQPTTWHCMDCMDYTVTHFFACLGFRTECDIFRIRSPFDEVNIWPESGRRDRHNGAGFVGF
jgi:hypothetical protein